MRLIDADALLKKYKGNILTAQIDYAQGARDIIEDIKRAPTIEPEQKKTKWILLRTRPMNEEERKEWWNKLGRELEDYEEVIYIAPLPEDGQDVLICLQSGDIRIDSFYQGDYGCYFVDSDIEEVVAWMPLPKPWEGEE